MGSEKHPFWCPLARFRAVFPAPRVSRAHLSYHRQQVSSSLEQVGQREQSDDLRPVLQKSREPRLNLAELALDQPERVFHSTARLLIIDDYLPIDPAGGEPVLPVDQRAL
jgi:hypothetical protein